MANYLLDANHISPLVTFKHPLRNKILAQLKIGNSFAIATPALHEILFGISVIPRAKQNLQERQNLKYLFKYYAVDTLVAEKSATLRVMLRKKGWQIEVVDSFIAIIALENNLVLLTTDKDFEAVPNLQVENWR